jgi:hypothetical protein
MPDRMTDAAPPIQHTPRTLLLAAAATAALLLAATVTLWVHYGTAVFLEIIRTGFAMCFG